MSKQKTQEEMFPLIESWESSTKNQEQFCRSHHVRLSTFTYWRSKYRKSQNPSCDIFTELRPEFSTNIEVIFPNGVKVCLPKDSGLSTIQALIRLG